MFTCFDGDRIDRMSLYSWLIDHTHSLWELQYDDHIGVSDRQDTNTLGGP